MTAKAIFRTLGVAGGIGSGAFLYQREKSYKADIANLQHKVATLERQSQQRAPFADLKETTIAIKALKLQVGQHPLYPDKMRVSTSKWSLPYTDESYHDVNRHVEKANRLFEQCATNGLGTAFCRSEYLRAEHKWYKKIVEK
jgi:hypothetical protein